ELPMITGSPRHSQGCLAGATDSYSLLPSRSARRPFLIARRGSSPRLCFFSPPPSYHNYMLRRLASWLVLCAIPFFLLGCTRGSATLAKPKFEDNVPLEDPRAVPVRECFAKFKEAMLKGDTKAVLQPADSTVVPWFQK